MRLTPQQIASIKLATTQHFGTAAKVYLFGSRADNRKKGGDIDLYIIPEDTGNLFDRKLSMLQQLYHELGEQKIDIVVHYDGTELLVERIAKTEGIQL